MSFLTKYKYACLLLFKSPPRILKFKLEVKLSIQIKNKDSKNKFKHKKTIQYNNIAAYMNLSFDYYDLIKGFNKISDLILQ